MVPVLYSDSLIELTETYILFRMYYFPFGSKKIELSDIDFIVSVEPSLMTGKWRIWGTGAPGYWLPLDPSRPKRDKIYFLQQKNARTRIGFTVEESNRFSEIPIIQRLINNCSENITHIFGKDITKETSASIGLPLSCMLMVGALLCTSFLNITGPTKSTILAVSVVPLLIQMVRLLIRGKK